MINWDLLYEKFGQSLSALKFENLALEYVKSVYNQYEWIPTKHTRDGNRDFHLLENDVYDIWGEAKYKKTGNTISRKDLDPTILSGLIHGNVKLIIFITNAHIPPSLIDRILLGGRIKNIKISCVLANQLESWLIVHKDIYFKYFEEHINDYQINDEIFQIQKISFYNIISQDFNPFELHHKMLIGKEYILSVIIYSNSCGHVDITKDTELPFVFIEHPNYDNPQNARFSSGITALTFLIKPQIEYSGCINIRLYLNNQLFFFITEEIEIFSDIEFPIVYAEQMKLNNKIFQLINQQASESTKYIITIHAESGMGKTFLLRNIYNNYVLKKDMTIVTFDSNPSSHLNYLLLCKILLFLYYGNIFWFESSKDISVQTRNEYKKIAIRSNTKDIFSNALLEKIIDGCYDANIAMSVICSINKKISSGNYTLIKGHTTDFGKILILDDFQYLTPNQSIFMLHIIKQLKTTKNNDIIIIAGTKNKFYNEDLENKFVALTPNYFTLEGMSFHDKQQTISKNFNLSLAEIPDSAVIRLPDNVLFCYEIIRSLKQNQNNINTSTDYVLSYIKNTKYINIFQNRFESVTTYYSVLDIVYRFKRGLPRYYIEKYLLPVSYNIIDALNVLKKSHLIIEDGEIIKPYHDYLISSYKNLRNKFFYNSKVEKFLVSLLEYEEKLIGIDYNQVLPMIIECNSDAYELYEKELKKQIKKYNYETQFEVVKYYGKIIYDRLKSKGFTEFSDEDFYYLYLYGNALIHCDNNHSACEILDIVYKNANKTSLERYEAGVQLINERYWNAEPLNVIQDSWILQTGIKQILDNDIKKYESKRLLKIYSSCINRRMVTYLLMEEIDQAFNVYRPRLIELIATYQDNYKTFSATLVMDYARGISYYNPKWAYTLLKLALNYFLTNPEIHYRRLPICYLDIFVLESKLKGIYCEVNMDKYINQLLQSSFYSEYFKGILKKCACKLIYITQILNNQGLSANTSFLQEISDEISIALITAELLPSKRELFLMNNILAYISIIQENFKSAVDYLETVNLYVKDIGYIYKKIAEHNFNNIYTINKICWYSQDLLENPSVFLLDTRFW